MLSTCIESGKMINFTKIGVCKIGKVLGRGAFGEVYEVSIISDSKDSKATKLSPYGYVLKKIKKSHFEMSEVEKLNLIYHQTFLYTPDDEEYNYILFPRMPGIDLQTLIDEKLLKQLDFHQRVNLLFQLSSQLLDISKKYIHRDIKAKNIIVNIQVNSNTKQDQSSAALIDLGISEPVDAKNPESIIKGHHTSGTEFYMAPEVFLGINSPKSDIYSLASVFIELLSEDSEDIIYNDRRNVIIDRDIYISEQLKKFLFSNLIFDSGKYIYEKFKQGKGHFNAKNILPESIKGIPDLPNKICLKDILITFLMRMQAFDLDVRPTALEVLEFCSTLKKLTLLPNDIAMLSKLLIISQGYWRTTIFELDDKKHTLDKINFADDNNLISHQMIADFFCLNKFKSFADIAPMMLEINKFTSFLAKNELKDKHYLFKTLTLFQEPTSENFASIKYLKNHVSNRLKSFYKVYIITILKSLPELAYDIDLKDLSSKFEKKLPNIKETNLVEFFSNLWSLISLKDVTNLGDEGITNITLCAKNSLNQYKYLQKIISAADEKILLVNNKSEMKFDSIYLDYLVKNKKEDIVLDFIKSKIIMDNTFNTKLRDYLIESDNQFNFIEKYLASYFYRDVRYKVNPVSLLAGHMQTNNLNLKQNLLFYKIADEMIDISDKERTSENCYNKMAKLHLLSNDCYQEKSLIPGSPKAIVRLFCSQMLEAKDKDVINDFYQEKNYFQVYNINRLWQVLNEKKQDINVEPSVDVKYLQKNESVDPISFFKKMKKRDPYYLINMWFYLNTIDIRFNDRLIKIKFDIASCVLDEVFRVFDKNPDSFCTAKNNTSRAKNLLVDLIYGKLTLSEYYHKKNDTLRSVINRFIPDGFQTRLYNSYLDSIKASSNSIKKDT